MTENKRYFKREWEEEYYIFDSTEISEEKFDEEVEYGYDVFANAMTGDTVVNRLNEKDNRIKELELENRQLKSQLQTDDICSKCKHEYLVKQDDGYFIAKCKKEHEECSKEYIRFCEDFEFELEGDVEWD